MKFFRANLLPIMGIITLVIVTFMSYVNNAIFLDRILICNVILIAIFIAKTSGQISRSETDSNNEIDGPFFK